MNLTVACLLWVGADTRYTPAWVYRLRDQVAEHLPLPHRFVCLSNISIPGVEVIPLRTGWPTWWAKVEIFDTANDLGDRAVYLDLDVFVTGNLIPIALYPAPIALMPPSHIFAGQKARELPGVVRRYQASCISWSPPVGHEIFDKCNPERMRQFRSDQDWTGFIKPDCQTMPKEWFAKAQQGMPSKEVKLVLAQRVDLIGKTLEDVVAC